MRLLTAKPPSPSLRRCCSSTDVACGRRGKKAEAAAGKQNMCRKTGQTSLQEESQPIQLAASKFAPVAAGGGETKEATGRQVKRRGGGGGWQVLRPAKELSGWSARCVTFTAQWAQQQQRDRFSFFSAGLVVTGTNNNNNNNSITTTTVTRRRK